MGLAEGIELQAAVHRPLRGKDGERLVIENEAVWVIIDNQYVMLQSEIHEPLVQLRCGTAPGRHIGIVGPHYLHPFEVHSFQGFEVRMPAIVLLQVVGQDFRSHEPGCGGVGRIARVRNEHLVTLVDECEADEENALLGAEKRLDFSVRGQCDPIIS